ncbi:MAG: hypothetical protein HZB71_03855 [Betaproteobacteria bacterium]|nr:hypothetical protein [Betaproteobacteria bacterium]
MASKKTAVIHIDALRREYCAARALQEKLELDGINVLLSSRNSTTLLLKLFTPDIFISSHVFQLSPKTNKALSKKGVILLIKEVEGVDHEDVVVLTYPKNHNGSDIDYQNFSRFYVWGKYTRDWLIKHRGIDKEKIQTTGSINQSSYLRDINNKPNKPVGIISRFEILNTFDKRHPFTNLIALDPTDDKYKWYYERCAIDSEVFSIICKIIDRLVKQDIYISIRPHPNENLESYKILKKMYGKRLSIDNCIGIQEWLSNVSVVIGTTSTAFADAYIHETPIISTSAIQRFHYITESQRINLGRFDLAAYTPNNIDEAEALCLTKNLKAKKSKELDTYFNEFYSLDSTMDPIDAIAADITNLVKQENMKTKRSNYHRGRALLYLIDLLTIIRSLISKSPWNNFKILKIYSYNNLIHRPSNFIKETINRIRDRQTK